MKAAVSGVKDTPLFFVGEVEGGGLSLKSKRRAYEGNPDSYTVTSKEAGRAAVAEGTVDEIAARIHWTSW